MTRKVKRNTYQPKNFDLKTEVEGSYIVRDGKKIFKSPEISIDIQKKLNSDIIMVFDECPEYSKDKERIENSMKIQIEIAGILHKPVNWAKMCAEFP